MAYENIVAVFQTLSGADTAVSELRAAGIEDSDIKLHSSAEAIAPPAGKGVWAHLLGDDISGGDVDVYEKCIANGWVIVSVTALEENAEKVMAVLASHSPVDLEETLETYGARRDAPSEEAEESVVRRFSAETNPPAERRND